MRDQLLNVAGMGSDPETATAVWYLITKYQLDTPLCNSTAHNLVTNDVQNQTQTSSDVGICHENVAERDHADARAAAATAHDPDTAGPSTISAEADDATVDQFEAASLANDAMREGNVRTNPRYVDITIDNEIKRMTMKDAFKHVNKRAKPSTNVDVAADASDEGPLDETIEVSDDDAGDSEPVSVDTEEARERLAKGPHKRVPDFPLIIEPPFNASHRAISRAMPKHCNDIYMKNEHTAFLLLMDTSGDVPGHVRRRLSLKNSNELRLEYSRYMTMRFTKPSYVRSDHTLDFDEFMLWLDRQLLPSDPAKPGPQITREQKQAQFLNLTMKRAGYNIPIEYQKCSFSSMTYVKMPRGDRHGLDPYTYALILISWKRTDARCDKTNECEPCFDSGPSVNSRWTRAIDWVLQLAQEQRLNDVLKRMYKPSYHLPPTVTNQLSANIRRYRHARNSYCKEMKLQTAAEREQYAVPYNREKALEMIAVIDARNKRTKTRVKKVPEPAPSATNVQSAQAFGEPEQLPSDDVVQAEAQMQDDAAGMATVTLDTDDDADYHAEFVSPRHTVDTLISEHVSDDTLSAMQTAVAPSTSRAGRAKGKSTPTKTKKPKTRHRKPENPNITSCDTPQLGVAKTTAPDTRGFHMEGTTLVQSPSQTRAKRVNKSKRKEENVAAPAESDPDVQIVATSPAQPMPLRPGQMTNRGVRPHSDQTWTQRRTGRNSALSGLSEAVVEPHVAVTTASHARRREVPLEQRGTAKVLDLEQSQAVDSALADEAVQLQQTLGNNLSLAQAGAASSSMLRAIQDKAAREATMSREAYEAKVKKTKAKAKPNVNVRVIELNDDDETEDVLVDAGICIGETPADDRTTVTICGSKATSKAALQRAIMSGIGLTAVQTASTSTNTVAEATTQMDDAASQDSLANVDVRQVLNDTMSTEGYEHGVPTSLEKRVLTTEEERDDDEHYVTANEGSEPMDTESTAVEQPMDTSEAPEGVVSTSETMVTPTTVAEQILRNVQSLPSDWAAAGTATVQPQMAAQTVPPRPDTPAVPAPAKALTTSEGTALAGPSGDATSANVTTADAAQADAAKAAESETENDSNDVEFTGVEGDPMHPVLCMSSGDEEALTKAAETAEAAEASSSAAPRAGQTSAQADKPDAPTASTSRVKALRSTASAKMAAKIDQIRVVKQEPDGVKVEPQTTVAPVVVTPKVEPKVEPSTTDEGGVANVAQEVEVGEVSTSAADTDQIQVAVDTAQTDNANVVTSPPADAVAGNEQTTSATAETLTSDVQTAQEADTHPLASEESATLTSRNDEHDYAQTGAGVTQPVPRLPDEQQLDIDQRVSFDMDEVLAAPKPKSIDNLGPSIRRRRPSDTDDAASDADDFDLCADPDALKPVVTSTPHATDLAPEAQDIGDDESIDEDALLNDSQEQFELDMSGEDECSTDGDEPTVSANTAARVESPRTVETQRAVVDAPNESASETPAVNAEPVVRDDIANEAPAQLATEALASDANDASDRVVNKAPASVANEAPASTADEASASLVDENAAIAEMLDTSVASTSPQTPAKTQKRQAEAEVDDVQAKRDKPSTSQNADVQTNEALIYVTSITLVRIDPARINEQTGPHVGMGPSLGVFRVHATFETPTAQQPTAE